MWHLFDLICSVKALFQMIFNFKNLVSMTILIFKQKRREIIEEQGKKSLETFNFSSNQLIFWPKEFILFKLQKSYHFMRLTVSVYADYFLWHKCLLPLMSF